MMLRHRSLLGYFVALFASPVRSFNRPLSTRRSFVQHAASLSAEVATSTMNHLKPLDSLTVKVLVDNDCDSMSSPGCVSDGFTYTPASSSSMRAGHGLSLLLNGTSNGQSHTVLLDAGADPVLWESNAAAMDIDVGSIEAAVLSHYHYDHSGGLAGAVSLISSARTSKGLEPVRIDLHSAAVHSRGRKLPDGEVYIHKPDNPNPHDLEKFGTVELGAEEHTISDDFFYVSGFVPRDYSYETGSPGSMTLVNGQWVVDEEIADERYVACRIEGRGLVVFSSCSHSGISNVCSDVVRRGEEDLFGVVGGFHLAGKRVEERIRHTVDDLKQMDPSVVIAGHCTGWRGKAQLATNFEGKFQPLAVGSTYTFLT